MRLWLLAALLFAVALGRDGFDGWVDRTVLPSLAIETSVEMRGRHGALLRAFTVADGRWRLATSLDQVDSRYVEMLLAYEDKRFYRHAGVDPRAMLRAVAQAVWHGEIVSGGSTLTMQVARLLEDGSTGEVGGKLRQIRLALALERHLSKGDILSLYLNRAPFGGNLEGVRAATLAYFGKEPHRLTTAEAALLVALPQSPETRRPDRHPDIALAARDRVLDRVLQAGVLDEETALSARTETVLDIREPFPQLAAHLTDRVRAEAPEKDLHHLTLDARLQARLEELATRAATEAGRRQSIAILVADHQTGEILASVGSAGYVPGQRNGFVDMTRALRSPGSTLKPLVYGLAFDQGLAHPETLIEDRPVSFGTYAPQNFDGAFRGTVRVRQALMWSLNIPVVKLLDAMGPAHLMAGLRRAEVEAKLPGGQPGLAVALGGVGVSLRDLVTLFAGLARGGEAVVLSEEAVTGPSTADRILSAESAWMVTDILANIPPPRNAARTGLAYKTGTSYGHRDAWAIGYDGAHVIGVWMGRPDGTPVPGAFGGEIAAPVLFETFARLKPELTPFAPPPPGTLIVEHAGLPDPLKHFRPRDAAFEAGTDLPVLAFPPDGASVDLAGQEGLLVRVRDGAPPFTWLADGKPVLVQSYDRSSVLPLGGLGFVTLSVIDGKGQAARATVRLE